MDLVAGTDLAGTDMAEAAVVPAADLGQGVDLALDLPVGNAPSACGHRRQCCTDLRAPERGEVRGGEGGEGRDGERGEGQGNFGRGRGRRGHGTVGSAASTGAWHTVQRFQRTDGRTRSA